MGKQEAEGHRRARWDQRPVASSLDDGQQRIRLDRCDWTALLGSQDVAGAAILRVQVVGIAVSKVELNTDAVTLLGM